MSGRQIKTWKQYSACDTPDSVLRFKTAGVVWKHGVDADYMTSLKMVDDDLVGHWKELTIWALAAFNRRFARLSTHAGHPLICTGGRVTLLPGAADPEFWKDILSAAKPERNSFTFSCDVLAA